MVQYYSPSERRSGINRRKSWGRRRSDSIFTAGVFRIDDWAKRAYVENQALWLSPKEYGLLMLLVLHPDRVVSTEEILARLWPADSSAMRVDVATYIHLLRRKIASSGNDPQVIRNVKGFGYQIDVSRSMDVQ